MFGAFAFIALVSLYAHSASAHQPRLTDGTETVVVDPEISKAYYGTLAGSPHTYIIQASSTFDLYVGILVPALADPHKDVSATIYRGDTMLATLGGESAEWKMFFEPFGQSSYWDGGEYKTRAEAGTYRIVVSSTHNDSKYSLAVGEVEAFDMRETVNTLRLVPKIKKNFFEESPASFILSPIGWGYVLLLYLAAFLAGLMYRLVLRRFAAGTVRGVEKNIGKKDRLERLILGVALLGWAIMTTWNPILLFFSGFCIFEAVFSWCGFYAAIGKNTCPV